MEKLLEKILSSFMVIFFAMSFMFTSITYAAEITESGNVGTEQDSIDRKDLFISSELAEEIAKLFIADMINIGDVVWNASTRILGVTTMNDGTAEHNITAYTVELDEGYVVVSAYVDVPHVVLEWSDRAMPLYQGFDLEKTDEIVYGGSLFYYKDGGTGTLETLAGLSVERSDVVNVLETQYDISNIPAAIVSALLDDNNASTMTTTPGSSDVITDPIEHANQWYNGPYSYNSGRNHWEEDGQTIKFHETKEYDGYRNHCGPTAITNMLIMYGNRFGVDSITSKTHTSVFTEVADIGTSNLYYINSETLGGTVNARVNNYILDVFEAYNVSGVTVDGRFGISYANIVTSLRNDRLLYLLLDNHDLYGDHHVICYAYTKLVGSTNSNYVIYLKVADGWANSPRYIDLSSVDGDKYWEIDY